MDPTATHPKPTVKKPHHRHHLHPQPDPTIQNISHRFSKLYANHKKKSTPPTTTTSLTDESNTHRDNYKRITTTTETKQLKKEIIIKAASDEEQEEEIKKKKKLIPSSIPPPPVVNNNNGRRRKSLCSISSSQLADFFSCAGVKVVAVDMPPFMQIHAVDCARKAHDSLEKFTPKTLALTLKKEFDGVYGPAWHCIVGTSFGSFVTHSVGGFMYFSMDHKLYILLFKTTVQRAPQES